MDINLMYASGPCTPGALGWKGMASEIPLLDCTSPLPDLEEQGAMARWGSSSQRLRCLQEVPRPREVPQGSCWNHGRSAPSLVHGAFISAGGGPEVCHPVPSRVCRAGRTGVG